MRMAYKGSRRGEVRKEMRNRFTMTILAALLLVAGIVYTVLSR
jgi:hypothetical protein